MMKTKNRKFMKGIFSMGVILSLFLFACTSKVSSAPPFGSSDDVKYSAQLWKALTDARLVGSQTITALPYKGSVHKTILI